MKRIGLLGCGAIGTQIAIAIDTGIIPAKLTHIFDDDKGDNTITLSGTDVEDFEFEGTVLYLKAGVLLDYERKRAHRVTVDVVDDSFEEGHDLVQITYSLNLIDR